MITDFIFYIASSGFKEVKIFSIWQKYRNLECFKKHSEQLQLMALLQQFNEDVISFDHSPLKKREGNWKRYWGRTGQVLFNRELKQRFF